MAAPASLILPGTLASAQTGWADRVDTYLATSPTVSVPLVSADAAGNVMAVWSQLTSTGQEAVRAARFVAASGAWAGAIDLSSAGTLQSAGFPALALNDAGDGVAVWLQGQGAVRSARYTAATDVWSPAVDLAPSTPGAIAAPAVAIAANGDAVALWSGPTGADTVIKAARYSVALATSSAPIDISGPNVLSPRIAIGPSGAAVAVWLRSDGAHTVVQTAVAPAGGGAWSSAIDVSAPDQSAAGPQVTIAASGAVLAIWTQGNGTGTTVLAARDATGAGAATGYVLDVSGALSGSLPLPVTDRFTYPAVPPGTYHLAVRAVNSAGSSAPSNSVTLTFPGACVPPAAPSTFSAAVSGRTIFASWTPPAAGPAATGYVPIVTGALAGSFSTTGLALSGAVGPGSYTLTTVAANACGISPATSPQTVIVH